MKSSAKPAAPGQANLSDSLDRLWARFLPQIAERVAVLESAAAGVAAGTLSASRRDAAQSAAHNLAGVLGTFNLTRGTILARELELTYSRQSALSRDSASRLAELAAELRSLVGARESNR